MSTIRAKENEPFEVTLRKFKRLIEKSGVLSEFRRREHHEKPTTVRKRKKAAAKKRLLKRLSKERTYPIRAKSLIKSKRQAKKRKRH